MSKDLVLITGVNGYIASVAAKHFLDHGHSVRGTVRKAASAKALLDGPLKDYAAAGKFTIVEVPDITVDGAFDEAVKDVTAIAHLATPVSLSFSDPAPVLHAAVTGTKTILASALKYSGPQLKSVVVMSSIAAVRSSHPPPYTFTENDWNDFAEKMCEAKGKETPGIIIYAASKVAAEKAFWEFKESEKPKFAMASVNPVFVIGPSLIAPSSISSIGETVQSIWKTFSGASPPAQTALPHVVDVRDVAQLLRYAVEHPEQTNGERYIASGAVDHPQALRDILREAFVETRGRIEEGEKGVGYAADYQDREGGYRVDSGKAKKLLEGGKWIEYRQSVVDTARGFVGLI
ncbi:putative NAD dependent epimerase/dehydratase [Phaeosphaeria sp. MPI-PUGE-AT-0046c]|nr:putative NAD dependent epimerase/dehydratase [Phaeosphaeria sp. MPI-PUGE-AT-0046c]